MWELGAMHNVQWPRTEAGESIRAGLLPVRIWCSSRTLRGDVKETFTGTFICSGTSTTTQASKCPTPSASGQPRRYTTLMSFARVQEMCLKLTFSLGLRQLCITATCQHKNDALALLHLLRFILSHIRASRSSTAATDTTMSTSHPRSRYPPLISALNLVLLSGLCLYTPSQVSHFKKIRRSRHAA